MAKLYLVRHQVAGYLTQFPFAQHPSDAQQAVLADYCARLYGDKHPKNSEPYSLTVIELDMLGPNEQPQALIPVGGSSRDNAAAVPGTGASGVGHVSNPKKGS